MRWAQSKQFSWEKSADVFNQVVEKITEDGISSSSSKKQEQEQEQQRKENT
jgi:hypothetical protein